MNTSNLTFSSHNQASEISRELIESIGLIDRDYFPWPWTHEFWCVFLDSRNFQLEVVTDQDTVIGFALFEIFADDSLAHLYKIVVYDAYRECGAALRLHSSATNNLFKINRIYLEVSIQNHKAIRFYERLGYKTIVVKKNFYADGNDALAMELQTSK